MYTEEACLIESLKRRLSEYGMTPKWFFASYIMNETTWSYREFLDVINRDQQTPQLVYDSIKHYLKTFPEKVKTLKFKGGEEWH